MIAILSDIHGNLEATEAVLADARAHDAQAIYCLGDLIGYGPDPIACVEHAMSWKVVLTGDFEHAAMRTDDLADWRAAVGARRTIPQFRANVARHPRTEQIAAFLESLPSHVANDQILFVHGSARDHLREYVFPEDVYSQTKMGEVVRPINVTRKEEDSYEG